MLVPRLGLAGAGIAALGSTILLAFGTFGYLRIWNGFRFDRMSILGTLLLFGSLAVGGRIGWYAPDFRHFQLSRKVSRQRFHTGADVTYLLGSR